MPFPPSAGYGKRRQRSQPASLPLGAGEENRGTGKVTD